MSATIGSTTEFHEFEAAVARSIDRHPIVSDNAYTRWFARGEATLDELRDFTVQFSAFSHLFIEAQLRKCINAPDLASYRAGKEILLNELGVTFAQSGSVDGGTFRFTAGHFELARALRPSPGPGVERHRKAPPRTRLDARVLRRADGVVQRRGRIDGGRRLVRDRALGRGRLLEGAHRGPARDQEEPHRRASARVLDVARRAAGEPRRAHQRRDARSVCEAGLLSRAVPGGGRGDARGRSRVLERIERCAQDLRDGDARRCLRAR